MSTTKTRRAYEHDRCAIWHHELNRELLSLDDRQLQEIGAWRDAVPAITAELLTSRGCSLRG